MSRQDQDLSELWSCFFNGPLPIVADANLVLTVLVRCLPLAPPYCVAAPSAREPTAGCENRVFDPAPDPTARLDNETRATNGAVVSGARRSADLGAAPSMPCR
jgi:hypothetical protein